MSPEGESLKYRLYGSFKDQEVNLIRAKREKVRDYLFTALEQCLNKDSEIMARLIKVILIPNSNESHFKAFFNRLLNSKSYQSVKENNEILQNFSDQRLSEIYQNAVSIADSASPKDVEKILRKQEMYFELYKAREDTRSLEQLQEVGLNCKIPEKTLAELRKRFSKYKGEVPIIELAKNEKVIKIGPFTSKISLVTHDWFDHIVVVDLMKQNGLFNKYEDLLQDLGNPLQRDVYSRQSERFASLGYEYRKSLYMDLSTYVPRFEFTSNFNRLVRFLESSVQKYPQHSENFKNAVNLINGEEFDTKLFEFFFNQMVAEYVRENDKYFDMFSAINSEEKVKFFDARYISLLIEFVDLIKGLNLKSKVDEINTYLESRIIEGVETDSKSFEFVVNNENIANTEITNLQEDRKRWISNNTGFLTLKNRIS